LRREHVRDAAAEPRLGCTCVNGRRSHEIQYKDGRYFGTAASFRADGSRAVVQHHGLHGAEGEDTGHFPSGAVAYRGQFRNNAQVGTWIWYNEDGSIQSTRDYPDSDTAAPEPQPEH
jgi:antitoxin component YwqK of YwqJK toxin-antitoxin module